MTPQQLIYDLSKSGGAIVSSGDASPIEIADAQATGRFATDEHGYGYILRTKKWLSLNKRRESTFPKLLYVLNSVLACWTHEANQGDGIMEDHVTVYEEAKEVIAEAEQVMP